MNKFGGIATQEAVEGVEKFLEFLKQEKGIDSEKIFTCMECNNHRGFIEEDGTMDGCICKHDEGERKYHVNNCMEYTEDYKGCPYFKE